MTPIDWTALLLAPVALAWFLREMYLFQNAYRREFGEEWRPYREP